MSGPSLLPRESARIVWPPRRPFKAAGPAGRPSENALLNRLLGFIGRHGTRSLALGIFLGLALPPLSALARPWLPESIFVLLVLAFLRVDVADLLMRARQRAVAISLTTALMLVAAPLAAGLLVHALGIGERWPGLDAALVLQMAAPPIMSAPAIAFLLGLDGALCLIVLVVTIILTPITAPLMTALFLDDALTLSPLDLALRLGFYLVVPMVVAQAIRRLAGSDRIAAMRYQIDGANVAVMTFFAIAIMDGVALRAWNEPMLVIGLTVLSFAIALALLVAGGLAFSGLGGSAGWALGIAMGNRNMGLMLAVLGASVPDLTGLYFAIAQFPIYLLPLIVGGRLSRRAEA